MLIGASPACGESQQQRQAREAKRAATWVAVHTDMTVEVKATQAAWAAATIEAVQTARADSDPGGGTNGGGQHVG